MPAICRAACRRCRVPRERCPLRHVPRTGIITLHNIIPRPAGMSRSKVPRTGIITLPNPLRGQRECPAAGFRENALLHYQACCADNNTSVPSTVISTEAEKSLTLYACFCNEHWPAYTFQAFISYPGDFSTAHGFTRAPLEMTY